MSNVYVYDITTADIYSEEDFGTIISSPTGSDDYQLITSTPTSSENWYAIANNVSQYSMGTISSLSAPGGTINSTYSYVSSGSATISSVVIDNVSFVWSGNGTLFEIENGLERSVCAYLTSGTVRLAWNGEAITEANISRTFSFNESSIRPVEDYGSSLTGSIVDYDDFGQISSPHFVPDNQDYGQIAGNPGSSAPIFPYGSSTLSGSAEESFSAGIPANTQLFNISGVARVPLFANIIGIGTLTISSSLIEADVDSYVGIGTISISATALEAYSAQTPEDTQLFSISGVSSTREIQVYGINPGDHLYPQPIDKSGGNIVITNTSIIYPFVDYTPHYGIEKNIGIGTTGIKLDGLSILRFSPSYEATGTLFGIGEKLESRTYVYDEYDFIEYVIVNTGSILDGLTLPSEDYGDLSYTESTESFGFIVDQQTNTQISGPIYPFGQINVVNGFSPQDTEAYPGGPGVGKSWSFTITGYIGDLPIYTLSGISSNFELQVYGKDYLTSGALILSSSLIEADVDSYVGIGTISISETGLESFSAQTPEDTQLFSISGTLVEKFVEDADESTQLFSISGIAIEKDVDSYVGIETILVSGTALEAFSAQTPEDTQLFSISGIATESITSNPPENTQLFSISGELVHPNIDFTPHYGIEKNIGIGTTGIQFRRGVGFTPDSEGNTRDARTYSNVYPLNDKVPGTGIGTFLFDQINKTAKYSPLTPWTGIGTVNVSTGFSPKDTEAYPGGPGVGKSWSFTRTAYIASGLIEISGVSLTREIQVYGINPGDHLYPQPIDESGGLIIISQQTSEIIVLETDSYEGGGSYLTSGNAEYTQSNNFVGSGSISISETALEAFSAQTPEDTQLFSISGTSLEAYSAQTPEIEVLYTIDGNVIETVSYAYNGVGSVNVNGSAETILIKDYPTTGSIRFVTRTSDNNYDTCDSVEVTCDEEISANVSLVVNPVDTTVLFNIEGIASTREIAAYDYTGINTCIISGFSTNIKLTHSESGFGTIFAISSSLDNEVDSYRGIGTLFAVSGGSEVYSAQTPESTILISINGSATTKIESEYTIVGIGQINLSGNSSTEKISTYTQIGSGLITLSGELVYPNIIFIPAYKGSGSLNVIGYSNNSLIKIYENTSGNLFKLSSGFESFSRATYIGIGTIYTQSTAANTEVNPFQISRTYVVIIWFIIW